MKINLAVTFIVLIYITLNAQEITMPLWNNGVPNMQPSDDIEKTEITERHTRISYVQDPSIAVFLPSKGNSTGDAVIICPGGGYWILAYDWEGTDIAKFFNSKGIAAIVLKYRLPVSKSNASLLVRRLSRGRW